MGIFIYLHCKNNANMLVIIEDKDIEDLIIHGKNKGKYNKLSKDKTFVDKLKKVYDILINVRDVGELKNFSSLHYEKLKYDYSGKSSVRIVNGRVERLIFTEKDNKIEINLLEINETHYGNKK